MAMTSWCEHCGAIHLEGPFVPQCGQCSPEDSLLHFRGWKLVGWWMAVIGGSWAVVGVLLFGLLWVFQ